MFRLILLQASRIFRAGLDARGEARTLSGMCNLEPRPRAARLLSHCPSRQKTPGASLLLKGDAPGFMNFMGSLLVQNIASAMSDRAERAAFDIAWRMRPKQSASGMRMGLSEMEFSEWEDLKRRRRHRHNPMNWQRNIRNNKQHTTELNDAPAPMAWGFRAQGFGEVARERSTERRGLHEAQKEVQAARDQTETGGDGSGTGAMPVPISSLCSPSILQLQVRARAQHEEREAKRQKAGRPGGQSGIGGRPLCATARVQSWQT